MPDHKISYHLIPTATVSQQMFTLNVCNLTGIWILLALHIST